MKDLRRSLIIFTAMLAWLCLGRRADAQTVTFSIGMAYVDGTASGDHVSTSALFQLVDLGADGVFDPIPAGSWVGGDDTVIAQFFANTDGWTSAAAFDLTDGTGTPGVFSRQFNFTLSSMVYTGEKIGIRWFPNINAADYASTAPEAGDPYGQFTRQSDPLYGGSLWIVPDAGDIVTFDPLITSDYDSTDGEDPESSAMADYLVLDVPEPRIETLWALALGMAFCFKPRVKRGPNTPSR